MPRWIGLIFVALVLGGGDARSSIRSQATVEGCAADTSTSSGDADLYCIELLSCQPSRDLRAPRVWCHLLSPSQSRRYAAAGERLYDVGWRRLEVNRS